VIYLNLISIITKYILVLEVILGLEFVELKKDGREKCKGCRRYHHHPIYCKPVDASIVIEIKP